jgi:hypothetical protein
MNPNIVDVGRKTQFKPGRVGNRAGAPRRKLIRTILVAVIEVPLSPEALKLLRPGLRADLGEGVTYGELLAKSISLRGFDKPSAAILKELFSCQR